LRAIVARKGTSVVYVRGDRRTSYGNIVRVTAAMVAAGVTTINLTTEDEEISP
jgi:biopolymer transport protein ExbD